MGGVRDYIPTEKKTKKKKKTTNDKKKKIPESTQQGSKRPDMT